MNQTEGVRHQHTGSREQSDRHATTKAMLVESPAAVTLAVDLRHFLDGLLDRAKVQRKA